MRLDNASCTGSKVLQLSNEEQDSAAVEIGSMPHWVRWKLTGSVWDLAGSDCFYLPFLTPEEDVVDC